MGKALCLRQPDLLLEVNYGANLSHMCNFFVIVAKWSHFACKTWIDPTGHLGNTLLQTKYAGTHKIDMATQTI
jgi:hypothetical protein